MVEFIERKRWVFFALPFTFTKYYVKESMLTITSGLFKRIENDCYMYKIQDVELVTSLAERIFGLLDHAPHEAENGVMQLVPNSVHNFKQHYGHDGLVSKRVAEIKTLIINI